MEFMDIGCNVNCWECTQECPNKYLLELSITYPFLENFFYCEILDLLNDLADLLISQGKNPEIVYNDLKILAVSFYVSRLKIVDSL